MFYLPVFKMSWYNFDRMWCISGGKVYLFRMLDFNFSHDPGLFRCTPKNLHTLNNIAREVSVFQNF